LLIFSPETYFPKALALQIKLQVTYKSSFSHSKHAFEMRFQSLRQGHRLQVPKYEVFQKNFRTNGDEETGIWCTLHL